MWTLASPLEFARDTGQVTLREYVRAVWSADERLGMTKSTAMWLEDDNYILKKVLEALCVQSFYHELDTRDILSRTERDRLAIPDDNYLLTLTKSDPAHRYKVVLDVQPTCHRWCSPHYKTGLVARNITSGDAMHLFGTLKSWEAMQQQSTIDHVLETIDASPGEYDVPPPEVAPETIRAACGSCMLGPDIALVTRHGKKIKLKP